MGFLEAPKSAILSKILAILGILRKMPTFYEAPKSGILRKILIFGAGNFKENCNILGNPKIGNFHENF